MPPIGFSCAWKGSCCQQRGPAASTATTTDTTAPKTQTTSPTTPRLSAFFTEVVCTLGTTPPQTVTSPPPNGGNGVIRTTTRRRHADSQPLMLQNPYRSQPRAPRCIQDRHRVNFFALAPASGRAGRQISRAARKNMATMKPTTPLHAPNKGPLKPPSPLRPKTAPKTPISHPQRRWRFQTHTGTSKQRRQGFQLRLSLREQRRQGFHTTGPPGRQGQAAVPAGPDAMAGPAISHLVSLTAR